MINLSLVVLLLLILLYGGVMWLLYGAVRQAAARTVSATADKGEADFNGFQEFLQRVQRAIAPGARKP